MGEQDSSGVSVKTIHIGSGILGDIYGLEELPKSCNSVACLWLLHGRNNTKEWMKHIATSCLLGWQKRQPSTSNVGLIAIAFDQRNHGTRLVHQAANGSWREGNETHAQDMFSVYHGTAADTSLLIDHLGSYIFQDTDGPVIKQHLVIGYSLGGHTAWQLFFNEPRISASAVIVGCPDYARLISDRARLSKRKSYTSSNGAGFLGSHDFPSALVSSVEKWDPKGMIFGESEAKSEFDESEQFSLRRQLDPKIKGKRLLLCSGGADKLVPYHCTEPFLKFLKTATSGWYQDANVYVEDIVYPGVGHECTEGMINDITRFISDTLAGSSIEVTVASKI